MMINASVPAHGWSAGMCPSGVSRRNLVIKTANSLERAWIPGIARAAVEHAIDARTLYAIVPQDRQKFSLDRFEAVRRNMHAPGLFL
jgi:hypothetical protein